VVFLRQVATGHFCFYSFLLKLKQQLKKAKLKTNKRYQNLKNNKQRSENKIQKDTKPAKITMCFRDPN
jgi:hypothetical protein